jgi:hypothetical protein
MLPEYVRMAIPWMHFTHIQHLQGNGGAGGGLAREMTRDDKTARQQENSQ